MKRLQGTVFPFFFLIVSLYPLLTFSEGSSPERTKITPILLTQGREEYTITPGDILEITVFEVDELNNSVRVNSTGSVTLPLLGSVKVQGFTEMELEERLEGLLGERYLQAPQVSVFVKEAGYFYVLGKVNKGGRFLYRPGITLQQAIAMAQGFFKDKADLNRIQITRGVNGFGKETFVVDYTLITEGKLKDMPIIKDDVVFVRGLGRFYVGGYVRKPGAFDYRLNMTLQQAITSAGGIDDIGKPSRIRINREKEDGGVEIMTVNYNKIKAGKTQDIKIKEDDIIYVPQSYLLGFVRAFFFSIGVGDRHNVGIDRYR